MRIKTVFLTLFLASSFMAGAQTTKRDTAAYRNRLYFSPFHMFISTFQMGYERETRKGNDVLVNINAMYNKDSDVTESGFGVEFQYRLKAYEKVTEKNRTKLYFSPFAQVTYYDETYRYLYYDPLMIGYNGTTSGHNVSTSAGGGILFGTKIITWQRFVADFYIGGGFKYPVSTNNENFNTSSPLTSGNYTGVFPKIGAQFGFAF